MQDRKLCMQCPCYEVTYRDENGEHCPVMWCTKHNRLVDGRQEMCEQAKDDEILEGIRKNGARKVLEELEDGGR